MLSLQAAADILSRKTHELPRHIRRWRDVYHGMSLHTAGAAPRFQILDDKRTLAGWYEPANYFGPEYQRLFDNLLFSRHPRESDLTRHWRYSQYRPHTQAPFLQIIEIVRGAIFQDGNWIISLPDREDQQYIDGNHFSGHDLVSYFATQWKTICEDPNGYFVFLPKQAWNQTTTPRVEPDVWFVSSRDILFASEDSLLFTKGEDEAWLVNTVAIFRFRKDAAKGAYTLADEGGYYAHGFGYLPAAVAGGVWNNQGFYDSWLTKAKPVADDFIASKSAEQLVDKEASHPWIIQAQTECPDCETGSIQVCKSCRSAADDCRCAEPQWDLRTCGTCGGSHYISNNPGERLSVPPELMENDLIKIINPSVEINKHHHEKNKDLRWQILDALHLTKTAEAQSGIAKTIDQERLYQFILSPSNDYFDRLIPAAIRAFVAYRHVGIADGVTRPAVYDFQIQKPTQFQIKTASDLLAELDAASKAGIPGFIRNRSVIDYVDKQYGGDAIMKRKSLLIAQLDVYATYSSEEMQTRLTHNIIDRRRWQWTDHLSSILDTLLRERGQEWFLRAEYEAVREAAERVFEGVGKAEPTHS